ncbi:MAG: hypothetical protein ACOYKZ_07235 [Chlamydiia bacterium]
MPSQSARHQPKRSKQKPPALTLSSCTALVIVDATPFADKLVRDIKRLEGAIGTTLHKLQNMAADMGNFEVWFEQQFQKQRDELRKLAQALEEQREHVRAVMRVFTILGCSGTQAEELVKAAAERQVDPIDLYLERVRAAADDAEAEATEQREELWNVQAKALRDEFINQLKEIYFHLQGPFNLCTPQALRAAIQTLWSEHEQAIHALFLRVSLRSQGVLRVYISRQAETLMARLDEILIPTKTESPSPPPRESEGFFHTADVGSMFEGLRGRPLPPPDNRDDELKRIFRRLARDLHPDTGLESSPTTKALWNEIMACYRTKDLEGLKALEVQKLLRLQQWDLKEHGLCTLHQLKRKLRAQLQSLQAEQAQLHKQPAHRWELAKDKPAKLKSLTKRWADEMLEEIVMTTMELDDLTCRLMMLRAQPEPTERPRPKPKKAQKQTFEETASN